MNAPRASLSIKFGFPNGGLTLRWGEIHGTAAGDSVNPFQWHIWWEVIVGNMAAVGREVQVAWTVQGRQRTTTVFVPPKGTMLGTNVTLPSGLGQSVRLCSKPDPALGEVGVWLPMGTFTFGEFGPCVVELPVNKQNLSRDLAVSLQGQPVTGGQDQIGGEWVESSAASRAYSTVQHGEASVEFVSSLTLNLPPTSAGGKPRPLAVKLDAPLFPEVKDPLGAAFAQTAVFSESERLEEEIELEDGTRLARIKEVAFNSPDESRQIRLVFDHPETA
ncbi:MAG: hypothetical protein HQL51_01650 [Magnetococcales bacterium]|nr:hypothetical protein [Magnetococcales bacterium]